MFVAKFKLPVMGNKTGFCTSSHICRMLIYNLYLQQKLTATENNVIRRSARIKTIRLLTAGVQIAFLSKIAGVTNGNWFI